jgi:hypothetical protein
MTGDKITPEAYAGLPPSTYRGQTAKRRFITLIDKGVFQQWSLVDGERHA